MSNYTLDVNGTRYELNEEFRDCIETRAELEYDKNYEFSCWWKTENGDPILVIETVGVMVPWDRMDQVEVRMPKDHQHPEQPGEQQLGRMHFTATPHRFEEIPNPRGEDPDKLPEKPERISEPSMVMWIPRQPNVDVTWGAGETITSMETWVEWNVQEKANQPRPVKGKKNSHDAFESLCRTHDCDVIAEANPSNDIPSEVSGSVERKGEQTFNEGKFGGDNWNV